MTTFAGIRTKLGSLDAGVGEAGARVGEVDVTANFGAWLANNNGCTATSDCVLISPGCPLGCWAAVRADRKEAAEAKAKELIGEYQRGGRTCVYACIAVYGAACLGGRCAVVVVDAGAAASTAKP